MTETSEAIWAVSDGRAGLRNQVLGLAEAIARLSPRPIETKTIDLESPWRAVPSRLLGGGLFGAPFAMASHASDHFAPPWPRVFIGCGRASIAASLAVKRLSEGKTFTVQTQDPRMAAHHFDLVVPPEHDGLTGANVFPILGSPNRITPEKLAEAAAQFGPRYAPLRHPRVGVLIGGTAKHLRLTAERTAGISGSLIRLTREANASLMITTSRRTGHSNTRLLAAHLSGHAADIWDGTGDNPYFGILALAQFLLVTEDSINMAADAATTGKPVFTLKLDGHNPKYARFHESLRARRAERAFEGKLEAFIYAPLREADRAAEEICRRAKLPILNRRQG